MVESLALSEVKSQETRVKSKNGFPVKGKPFLLFNITK